MQDGSGESLNTCYDGVTTVGKCSGKQFRGNWISRREPAFGELDSRLGKDRGNSGGGNARDSIQGASRDSQGQLGLFTALNVK